MTYPLILTYDANNTFYDVFFLILFNSFSKLYKLRLYTAVQTEIRKIQSKRDDIAHH